jgi:hypothetical protein
MQQERRSQISFTARDDRARDESRFAESESQKLATKKFSRKTPKARRPARIGVARRRIERSGFACESQLSDCRATLRGVFAPSRVALFGRD